MAYKELVKNFNGVRDYMREFYVYGFKSREDYTQKSARSYDDERRRIESWLGEYMQFRHRADGKCAFLSIDSRAVPHNPLYQAWKTKSFTDGDITLHFLLMDGLQGAPEGLTLKELTDRVDQALSLWPSPRLFDLSTVRKKLKEYMEEGIVLGEKQGKTMVYRLAKPTGQLDQTVLDFFSEVSPCGVIGSFLLDQGRPHESIFSFRHHYITSAMDSEVFCDLFLAMGQKREVILTTFSNRNQRQSTMRVLPLRVMISAQSGRQYLMAYRMEKRRISSVRTDHIVSVQMGAVSDRFDLMRQKLDQISPHIWGVATQGWGKERMEQVSFTIRYGDQEQYIPKRLEREKRCGTVTHLDRHTCRFDAEVFDASELVPWIRTFLCRITDLSFSNETLQKQFWEDVEAMYEMYGIEGETNEDV